MWPWTEAVVPAGGKAIIPLWEMKIATIIEEETCEIQKVDNQLDVGQQKVEIPAPYHALARLTIDILVLSRSRVEKPCSKRVSPELCLTTRIDLFLWKAKDTGYPTYYKLVTSLAINCSSLIRVMDSYRFASCVERNGFAGCKESELRVDLSRFSKGLHKFRVFSKSIL